MKILEKVAKYHNAVRLPCMQSYKYELLSFEKGKMMAKFSLVYPIARS